MKVLARRRTATRKRKAAMVVVMIMIMIITIIIIIIRTMNSYIRIDATRCSLETWFVSGI
jgi:Tfp pilus assembly protein PilX